MPDPLDFDRARRALDDVPAPDLWADASRRAEAGAVVPLPGASGERARRPRWLVAVGVAAVAVLAVGTAAALLADDDQSVETTPTTEEPSGTEDVTVYRADGADCPLGISGEPQPQPVTVSLHWVNPGFPPPTDSSGKAAPYPDQGTDVEGDLNDTQAFAIAVPGHRQDESPAWRVADVQLERGTAQLWLERGDGDAVEVSWFSGSQEECESFTVTVAGGSEDANRHAAVDLAERVRLPSELGEVGVGDLDGTDWQLERSTVRGEPTEGTGSAFTFADGEVGWTDGCNSFGATYTQPSPTSLVLGDVSSTDRACAMNATTQAIGAVMGSDDIRVTTTGSSDELLVISSGETTLTLRPAVSVGEAPELAGTEWRVVALYRGDEEVLPRPDHPLIFMFGERQVTWDDDCNSPQASYAIDPDGFLTITPPLTTLKDCEGSETFGVIGAVMGADRIYMDEMGGQLELSDTQGNHIALEPV